MNWHRKMCHVGAGALMLLLAACMTSTGTINSNKSEVYASTTRKLFIVGNMGSSLIVPRGNENGLFSSTMSDTLASCGTQTEYFAPDPLAIKDVAGERIRKFGPDAILTINWQSERSGNYVHDIVFLLQLLDVKSNAVVWKASINFSQHWNPAVTLAGIIIGRMKQDGLIDASCTIPHVT
jgi:hypothetical protein